MSRTTMYVARESGDLIPEFEYSNGWGSAPVVWDALTEKYQAWSLRADGTIDEARHIRPEYFNWMGGKALTALIAYHRRDLMRPWEHNCLVFTLDNFIVEAKDFGVLAESLRVFDQAHATPGRVCHLPAMADHLDKLSQEGARAAAWLHTSVSEFWGSTYMYGQARDNSPDDEDPEVGPYNIDEHNAHWTHALLPLSPTAFVKLDPAPKPPSPREMLEL